VEDERLPGAAAALARRLASGPTLAYGATKALLSRELDMGLSSAIELEATTQALLMRSEDHAEFYQAFTEGRAPNWTGR
jgi:enoyl-CoA hydratase/carnithine racemase